MRAFIFGIFTLLGISGLAKADVVISNLGQTVTTSNAFLGIGNSLIDFTAPSAGGFQYVTLGFLTNSGQALSAANMTFQDDSATSLTRDGYNFNLVQSGVISGKDLWTASFWIEGLNYSTSSSSYQLSFALNSSNTSVNWAATGNPSSSQFTYSSGFSGAVALNFQVGGLIGG